MATPKYTAPSWLGTSVVVGLLVLFAVTVVADIFVDGYEIPESLIWIVGPVVGLVLSIRIGLGGGGGGKAP